MAGVPGPWRGGGLDLNGDDAAVGALDNEVDLVLASLVAQMVDGGVAQGGVDPDALGDQGLEEGA